MFLQRMMTSLILTSILTFYFCDSVGAQDEVELSVIHKIKQEAFKHTQVMEYLFQMTEVYGPRITNSPGLEKAANWVVDTANRMGLENVALEPWEGAGRGWSTTHFEAHLREPAYLPMIGVPLTWAPGTGGPISGTPILAPLQWMGYRDTDKYEVALERYFDTWRGKLSGQIVLMEDLAFIPPITSAPARRWSTEELAALVTHPEPQQPMEIDPDNFEIPQDNEYQRERFFAMAPLSVREKIFDKRRELNNRLQRFLVKEGVKLAIYPSRSPGSGGTVFPQRERSARPDAGPAPPSIVLTPEHFNRLVRLTRRGLNPVIEADVAAQFYEEDSQDINIVAEIPGGKKKDELVIIGGHFDDAGYGTGATDNAAGSAVMLEVMRILSTLDLKLDRTVRMVLWSSEEQSLRGSRAYVKKHFADPETMQVLPAHGKVSAYYNFDNGTGKIRGIYLQENDMVRDLFESWLAPFADMGASTVSIRNSFGSDHIALDEVGIPSFDFMQDDIEYTSRTHHSNMDVYDRVLPSDLIQASAIIASFVYHTANRGAILPRKSLPELKQ